MAQVHEAVGTVGGARRAPNTHSEALQEAKRREKMQTISSSHRFTSPVPNPGPTKDAAS